MVRHAPAFAPDTFELPAADLAAPHPLGRVGGQLRADKVLPYHLKIHPQTQHARCKCAQRSKKWRRALWIWGLYHSAAKGVLDLDHAGFERCELLPMPDHPQLGLHRGPEWRQHATIGMATRRVHHSAREL